MSFNFNGVPSAEVTISGELTTKDYYASELNYVFIENEGTDELTIATVPAGKKWLIKNYILVRGTMPTGVSIGYATTPNTARIKINVDQCTTSQNPLNLWVEAGEKIGWYGTDPDSVDGWLSYLEFDE